METIWQDVRYGLRSLYKSPGFAAIAVAALALGIGCSVAIFTVVNAVLLRPLPYSDPDRLVMIFEGIPRAFSGPIGFSPPDFAYLQQQTLSSVFEVAAFSNKQYELSGVAEPERLTGARVSPSLFSILGVRPALGRAFTREDDQPGRNLVILSNGLWRRKFGSNPSIIGESVTLDRQSYTVVGVMPASFNFPHRGPISNNQPAEFWVPIAFTPSELQAWLSMYNHSVLARLKPGVTLEQARGEMKAMMRRIEEVYPADAKLELASTVEPFRKEVVGRTESFLFVLLAAVGMVLLIGCADVANLLLGRARERQREMAIRIALGAGRLRIIRQLLTESVLLALCGGALGILFSAAGANLLVQLSPASMPRVHEIRLDETVLAFAVLLSMSTAVLFGLVPALEASRSEIGDALKEGGRTATQSRRQRRVLSILVSAQFAMAVVLLAGAGLLLRSFITLLATEPGFRPEQVLSMSMSLPASSYSRAEQIRSFYQRLLENVEAIPGVKAASAATDLPLAVRERRSITPEVQSGGTEGIPRVTAHVWALGEYFEALRIPLKKGRYFTRRDGQSGERVVIINETMAAHFWPGQDPLGHRMKWGGNASNTPWMTIVGVVGNVKQGPLRTETVPQTYEPYLQVGGALIEDNNVGMLRSLTLIVRAEMEPAALIQTVRQQVRALDPALPVVNVQTLEQHVSKSVAPERFNTYLLGAFAVFALILAAIGIYGVMARSVAQRTHEIGVRMALGARRSDVLKLVARPGMTLAACGIAIGIGGALAFTRVLAGLLFGVQPYDPWTFSGVVALLCLVALLACYIPARRAARVDPMVALRYE